MNIDFLANSQNMQNTSMVVNNMIEQMNNNFRYNQNEMMEQHLNEDIVNQMHNRMQLDVLDERKEEEEDDDQVRIFDN